MNSGIQDAICSLEEIINETQEKINILRNIDLEKPVTEEQWHKICETPLRYSNLLAVLIKNTFPMAENIILSCNYVYFDIMGFEVQVPTSNHRGINIDLSWYKEDYGEPVRSYSRYVEVMKNYFEAVDNKAGWYECAKRRLQNGEKYRKWYLFFIWWFKYKWRDPKRAEFETAKSIQDETFVESVKKYYIQRNEIKNKTRKMINELLPILDAFSTQHYQYDGRDWEYSIERIKMLEQL